jgi:hypothetical protein
MGWRGRFIVRLVSFTEKGWMQIFRSGRGGVWMNSLVPVGWSLGITVVGDVLAIGFWAARISEIKEDDTVLIM